MYPTDHEEDVLSSSNHIPLVSLYVFRITAVVYSIAALVVAVNYCTSKDFTLLVVAAVYFVLTGYSYVAFLRTKNKAVGAASSLRGT